MEMRAGVTRPVFLPSTQIAAPAGSLLAATDAVVGANCTLTTDLLPEVTSTDLISVANPDLLMVTV